MTKRAPRRFTPEDKINILKAHLVHGEALSEVCEAHQLTPSLFHTWCAQLFEGGTEVFRGSQPDPRERARERKVKALEGELARQRQLIAEISAEYVDLKKADWGALSARWVPMEVRDEVVDFVRDWSEKTGVPKKDLVDWIDIAPSKFFDWQNRFGQPNEHNSSMPREHWLDDREKEIIIAYRKRHPELGYRRLAQLMLNEGAVEASPSSVYRVLKDAGLYDVRRRPRKK